MDIITYSDSTVVQWRRKGKEQKLMVHSTFPMSNVSPEKTTHWQQVQLYPVEYNTT